MYFIYKMLRSSIRNNMFLIIGLFLGVGLSVFMSQIVENNCIFDSNEVLENTNSKRLMLNDEYEPRINLAGKPLKALKTPQEFIRPRYYTTELGIRDKLLIGVMTSPNRIQDHAVPLNITLHTINAKTLFFMEAEPSKHKSSVNLNGIVQFSDSRTILKPFHMLKYLSDNYIEEYDYFFITRDTSYIHGRNLEDLVNKISVSQNVHMGSGKQDSVTSFCSIDAGILLSNQVLKKIVGNLDWCVKNIFSDGDDTNLGRCIVHSSNLPCTDTAQGLTYTSYHFDKKQSSIQFDQLDQVPGVADMVSLWPIDNADELYRLHLYFAKVDLQRTKLAIADARGSVLNASLPLANNTSQSRSWPVGNQPPNKPGNRFDLLRWDYFTQTQIYLKSDFSNVDDLVGQDLLAIQHVMNTSIQYINYKYGDQLQFKRLVNGYRRFDPSRGMDYIVELAFQDMHVGKEVHRRLELCQPLGKVELIPVPFVTENVRVNIVLVVTESNIPEVLHFMEAYQTVCMEKRDKTHLMLVLIYGAKHPGKGNKDDLHAEVKKMAIKLSERFKRDSNKVSWLSVKLPDDSVTVKGQEDVRVNLSEGLLTLAALDLVLKKFKPENLMLLCLSNMELRQDYINRVRMNTVRGWQVFSPIPFTEFDPLVVYSEDLPRPKELDINKNYGHYDKTEFGHISFYVKDYRAVRKTIEDLVPAIHTDRDLADVSKHLVQHLNWKQSQDQAHKAKMNQFQQNISRIALTGAYGMFANHAMLNVLRATEPGLRVRHQARNCAQVAMPEDLLRPLLYDNCVIRRNSGAGTRSHLGRLVLDFVSHESSQGT